MHICWTVGTGCRLQTACSAGGPPAVEDRCHDEMRLKAFRQPDEQEDAAGPRHALSGTIGPDSSNAKEGQRSEATLDRLRPSSCAPLVPPAQAASARQKEDEGEALPHQCMSIAALSQIVHRTAARRAEHRRPVQGNRAKAERLTRPATRPQTQSNRVESAQKPPSELRASSSRSTTLGSPSTSTPTRGSAMRLPSSPQRG